MQLQEVHHKKEKFMEKKEYKTPEVEVTEFENEDIIAPASPT